MLQASGRGVCNAIAKYIVPLYLKVPSTEEEWLSVVEKFETRWKYPNAIAAIGYRRKTCGHSKDITWWFTLL